MGWQLVVLVLAAALVVALVVRWRKSRTTAWLAAGVANGIAAAVAGAIGSELGGGCYSDPSRGGFVDCVDPKPAEQWWAG